METEISKSERIAARVTPERTLTGFVVKSAQKATEVAVAETQIIRLSAENQRRFAEAILKSGEPNEALRVAAKAYDDAHIMSLD